MRRRLGVVMRLFAVAIGIVLLCYVTARALLANQIHRASQMLEKVQDIKIGDTEDSIGPLLRRFPGYRWDTQLGALEDYNYVLEINPWRYPTFPGASEHPIGMGLNARFRRAIGLRRWLIASAIAIKNRRVVAIQAEAYVEGKAMWLGTYWRLSEKPREFERDPKVDYLEWPPKPNLDFVTPGILEMGTGGGITWEFWIAPSLPRVRRDVATHWKLGCLDSFEGCESLCDLLPEAEGFFKEHTELAPRGGGWDENSQACKHNPYEGRY